jgi:hypothetical protein
VQAARFGVIAALAASLALSACTTTSTQDSLASTASASSATSAAGVLQRDLTPQEKKAIVDAVAPSLRNPGAAKYKWAKFPTVVTEDSVNYCATVDAQSPFAAYSGHQAYIIEAKVVGGHVTSAVMGLIAGGKDYGLVSRMCSKYGLDPNKSS